MDETIHLKLEVACVMCNMVLNDPVTIPCGCHSCNEHLHDHFAIDNKIKCSKCNQVFEIPKEGFRVSYKTVKNIVNKDLYLSKEEKACKNELQTLLEILRNKNDEFLKNNVNLELCNEEHFSELIRQIDLHREKLKLEICEKIDHYALDMIAQTRETQRSLKNSQKAIAIPNLNIEKERRLIANVFRKVNLSFEQIQQLKNEQKEKIKYIDAQLGALEKLADTIQRSNFKANADKFATSIFGKLNINLKPKPKLISCSDDKTIKEWDLEAGKCINTITGHTSKIWGLEKVSNNLILSCSSDKSIKLWSIDTGVCIETFHGHKSGVVSLQILTENTFASGSNKDIKIWDIKSGLCIKTLNEHEAFVRSLAKISKNVLVSCSEDKTIKVWDIEQGVCTKTLLGHTEAVFSILLLNDGTLASASADTTIKTWNLETGN